jgi:Holliday junction resolvase RusA-like endonuclease
MKFTLPLPPPLNACYGSAVSRNGRPYPYKRNIAKTWQRDAIYLIISQVGKITESTLPVSVDIKLYVTRNRDIDSSHKLLLDTLQMSHLIKNDMQIIHLCTDKVYPSKEPRVMVDLNYVGATTNKD